MDTSYFCFIHFSPEDHIVHIGYGSNRRTVVKRIRLDHRITNFNRNIQNHTGNGRTNLCRTGGSRPAWNTFTDNLQCILCIFCFFLCFLIIRQRGLIIFLGNNSLFIQFFITFVGCRDLFQIDTSHTDTRFSTVQLNHFRDYLDLCNDLTFLHHLTGLLQQFGDDTGHLRFDKYLITRFHLSCRHSLRLYWVAFGSYHFIHGDDRLCFFPQEVESADHGGSHQY